MDSQTSFRRAVAGLVAVSIALVFAGTADAAYPGRNGKIAFSANWDGNYDIYTTGATGHAQLTNDLRADVKPRWSPDGTRIAFMRSEPGPPPGYSLYVMDADGSHLRFLVRATQHDFAVPAPTWSPDGDEIAYSRGSFTAQIIPASGGTPRNAFRPEHMGLDPAWAPDGSAIAYVDIHAAGDLFKYTADGRTVRLTDTPSLWETSPAWSPDSRRIVYDDERWLPADGTGLRTMNPEGTGVAVIPGTRFDRDPQWSPDGQRLVASSWDAATGTFDLVTLDPDGSRRAAVIGAQGNEIEPDWQPIPGPQREDYKNASAFCAAERAFFGDEAFALEYGGGPSAFGKCVSAKR